MEPLAAPYAERRLWAIGDVVQTSLRRYRITHKSVVQTKNEAGGDMRGLGVKKVFYGRLIAVLWGAGSQAGKWLCIPDDPRVPAEKLFTSGNWIAYYEPQRNGKVVADVPTVLAGPESSD